MFRLRLLMLRKCGLKCEVVFVGKEEHFSIIERIAKENDLEVLEKVISKKDNLQEREVIYFSDFGFGGCDNLRKAFRDWKYSYWILENQYVVTEKGCEILKEVDSTVIGNRNDYEIAEEDYFDFEIGTIFVEIVKYDTNNNMIGIRYLRYGNVE